MTTTNELYDYCRKQKKQYPNLAEEIEDFWQLCMDEIEEGSSVQNEIDLCESSIDELINVNN